MAYLLSLFVKSFTNKSKKDDKRIYLTVLFAVGIVAIIGIGTALHYLVPVGNDAF